MSAARIYEGSTVRIALTGLTHDEVGTVEDQNATVTFVAYRAAGTTLSSGTMTYSHRLNAWIAAVLAPAPATNPEVILVEIEADTSGALGVWRTTFDVYEAGP